MTPVIATHDLIATIVVNPAAGQCNMRPQVQQAADELAQRGWHLTIEETRSPGDAVRLARQAAATGQDVVLVVGGDGTLNEAANGLVGSETALGLLSVGTGNSWARLLGLPIGDLTRAARLLAEGCVRTVDVGCAGDRYFLQWAGVGFDATVTQEVESRHQDMKKRLGPLAYIVTGILVAIRYPSTDLRLTVDGRTVYRRAAFAVVANARRYAGILPLAGQTCLDDGWLALFVFRGSGFCRTLRHFILLLLGRHTRDAAVWHARVQDEDIRATRPLNIELDGEPAGMTPVRITVVPKALRVLVPHNLPPGLFSDA